MARLTSVKNGESRSNATLSSVPEATGLLSREDRFKATVAAMNTLLIEKRIYTQQEFDTLFCEWAKAHMPKPRKQRAGKR